MFKYSLALILLALSLSSTAEPLRDPTRPLREAAPVQHQEPSFTLNAILSGRPGGDLAIINGQTLAEGEAVDGAKVIRIRGDRVVLQHKGRSLELRLHSSSVRSNAGTLQRAVKK